MCGGWGREGGTGPRGEEGFQVEASLPGGARPPQPGQLRLSDRCPVPPKPRRPIPGPEPRCSPKRVLAQLNGPSVCDLLLLFLFLNQGEEPPGITPESSREAFTRPHRLSECGDRGPGRRLWAPQPRPRGAACVPRAALGAGSSHLRCERGWSPSLEGLIRRLLVTLQTRACSSCRPPPVLGRTFQLQLERNQRPGPRRLLPSKSYF